MGWTGSFIYETWNEPYRDGKGGFDRKAFLDNELTETNDNSSWKVLKSVMVGSTYYAAIERTIFETGEKVIYATVCLTSIENNQIWYKDMSEDMGPYKYDCPLSILSLLSPTDNKYALEWRKQCRIQVDKKAWEAKVRKLAKVKERWVKYTLPRTFNKEYEKGDVVWLHYRAVTFKKGRTQFGWSDGQYRWPRTMIDWSCCEVFEHDAKTPVSLPPKRIAV